MIEPIFVDAVVGPADAKAQREVLLDALGERASRNLQAFTDEYHLVGDSSIAIVVDPEDPVGGMLLEHFEFEHVHVDLGEAASLYYVVCCTREKARVAFGAIGAVEILDVVHTGAAIAVVAAGCILLRSS